MGESGRVETGDSADIPESLCTAGLLELSLTDWHILAKAKLPRPKYTREEGRSKLASSFLGRERPDERIMSGGKCIGCSLPRQGAVLYTIVSYCMDTVLQLMLRCYA